MKRDDFTIPLAFPGELIIDNFAGGGGTSTGLEAAFGRPVDIAINHDPEALAMHALNHPHTLHHCESVWDVNPIKVTNNQPVGLVWLSPDCKHFSKAKGDTPVNKKIRGLAWVGMRWIAMCKPRVMMLENVEEFKTWGPVILGADGKWHPDPARKGKTFDSFVRQLRGHGYKVDWRELRASDHGTPTIRKRLFLVARRDGLPITWPEQTHAEPTDRRVITGKLAAHRTAAECIDFTLTAISIFDRKKSLVTNTLRRVAKGLWRHVLTSAQPFIINDENCLSTTAPVMAPLRGTSESHLKSNDIRDPAGTVSASGTHHALISANLVTIGYGERHGQKARTHDMHTPTTTATAGSIKQAITMAHLTKFNTGAVGCGLDEPTPTITAGGTPKRPSTGITLGIVAAHLVDMGHGEGKCGTKRFSHGVRTVEKPLNTVTASGATSGLVSAFLEQANGGFYEGDGREAGEPVSTITSTGSNQRLVSAYLVKYYGNERDGISLSESMHTLPTKDRMGLIQVTHVSADNFTPEQLHRAKACAALLREHLPEHFSEPADLILMQHAGQWWALVDITLRMLKPRELYRAQGFPEHYLFEQIPDPAKLFKDGKQAAHPLEIPLINLSNTSQVRMCGNSVCPPVAEALVRANFAHENLIYGRAAA